MPAPKAITSPVVIAVGTIRARLSDDLLALHGSSNRIRNAIVTYPGGNLISALYLRPLQTQKSVHPMADRNVLDKRMNGDYPHKKNRQHTEIKAVNA